MHPTSDENGGQFSAEICHGLLGAMLADAFQDEDGGAGNEERVEDGEDDLKLNKACFA